MLQYLVILLDDSSTSYCHYDNSLEKSKLIDLSILKKALFFGMCNNLSIQFVYPDYILPKAYKDAINTVDHCDIISAQSQDQELKENAAIIVLNGWSQLVSYSFTSNKSSFVLRISKNSLFEHYRNLNCVINTVERLNIVLTDVESFSESDFDKYKEVLEYMSDVVCQKFLAGKTFQSNVLTDRIVLDDMNNCNAGEDSITIAPDGSFYVCPAFYYEKGSFCLGSRKFNIGNIENGLDIKNQQLYKIKYAPLCRICDAFQCKRCVWLNRKTTYEVNTPSHEQCVVAHLERNASRDLLYKLRKNGVSLSDVEINKIDYLDPFEIYKK